MPKSAIFWCSSIIGFGLFCHVVIYLILDSQVNDELKILPYDESKAILLWWTPFITKERRKVCGNLHCFVTADRSYLSHPNLKSLLFYGSSLDKDDVPPRGSCLWGLFHEESPRNVPILSHAPTLSLFNYSATFSRASHLPLTLQYLPSLQELTSSRYFKTFEEKQKYRSTLGPIMYLQSDCSTPNNRDSYVGELMKFIQVDSYGDCLNNRRLPDRLKNSTETMMSESLMELVSRYKFSIAFENAVCDDYITEKLWRPLMAGSVPLYVGSPSARDWLPNDQSAIFPMEFAGPKELAVHLRLLDGNKEDYENHLRHKLEGSISNTKLKENFTPLWPGDSFGVIDDFECLLCKKSYDPEPSILNVSHYSCPQPLSILSREYNETNWWHLDYSVAACEAEAFKEFLIAKTFKEETFSSSRTLRLHCPEL